MKDAEQIVAEAKSILEVVSCLQEEIGVRTFAGSIQSRKADRPDSREIVRNLGLAWAEVEELNSVSESWLS